MLQTICTIQDDEQIEIIKAISSVDEFKRNPNTRTKPRDEMFLHAEEIEAIEDESWMKDKHIDYFTSISRKQFPEIAALYNSPWLITGFPSIEGGKWMQILNVNRNHWILAHQGFIEPINIIMVCDSMVRVAEEGQGNPKGEKLQENKHITTEIKDAVAQIIKTPNKTFSLRSIPCQQQTDGFNCGVFAIANATSLLLQGNLSNSNFDVTKMRPHLKMMLKTKTLTLFPTSRSKRTNTQFQNTRDVDVPVYCTCRMPWHDKLRAKPGKGMVECCTCFEWFHKDCDNIPKAATQSVRTNWNCSTCSAISE